jgi:rare lipoprotein A
MLNRRGVIAAVGSATLLAACQSMQTLSPTEHYRPGPAEIGLASWYGPQLQGKRTASGERFDMNTLTAAHRTLPLNSYARVTNLATGRSVVVRINDRGPYLAHRIIDLSARAARELGIEEDGVARVRVEPLSARKAPL